MNFSYKKLQQSKTINASSTWWDGKKRLLNNGKVFICLYNCQPLKMSHFAAASVIEALTMILRSVVWHDPIVVWHRLPADLTSVIVLSHTHLSLKAKINSSNAFTNAHWRYVDTFRSTQTICRQVGHPQPWVHYELYYNCGLQAKGTR